VQAEEANELTTDQQFFGVTGRTFEVAAGFAFEPK
jgi:hypothetical protein